MGGFHFGNIHIPLVFDPESKIASYPDIITGDAFTEVLRGLEQGNH
jgi:hypothetical protein